jgi:hypothetical protein
LRNRKINIKYFVDYVNLSNSSIYTFGKLSLGLSRLALAD